MKFSTTLFAVAIATGAVSAVALPEADPGCWHPGQPCAVKARAAEAEAGCWHPGQPCAKAKRAADAFAEALAEVFLPSPSSFNLLLAKISTGCTS